MDAPFFEPYLRIVDSRDDRDNSQPPRPYVRTSPRPGTEEFMALKRALNGLPKERLPDYNTGAGGAVISFGFEREGNRRIKEFRAREIEAENRRKEAEDSRIVWTE